MAASRYAETESNRIAIARVMTATTLAIVSLSGLASAQDRKVVPSSLPTRVSFLNDVEPILTRAGCNQGSCHGSQFGKGGFKLSLAAYDPDFDYFQIARQAGGRRVNKTVPAASLLLRKPALQSAHQGGLRLPRSSSDYHTLLRWLAEGSSGPDSSDPTVVSIRVFPSEMVLKRGKSVQLTVRAKYSNGDVRDVTAHSRISGLNDAIAPVTPDGLVTAKEPGATAAMIRYAGLATVAHVSSPYVGGSTSRDWSGWSARAAIDRAVERRWKDLNLAPSPLCTDTEFLRRASLDVIGTLPTPDEVRAFSADPAPDKRERLIDRLLERPEYADYWTLKWSDLLRNSRNTLGARSMWAFNAWIRQSLAENMGYDRFVRELLTARGLSSSYGPANYYRVATTPQDLTETTAQLFLGIRLQCAKCHHHPFEKWSQQDYYQFAAFFSRVGTGEANGEPTVRLLAIGEVTHPKTGKVVAALPLALDEGPRTAGFSTGGDCREALASWLTNRDNRLFARVLVNRYWGALMGRGIVDPVDDMRVTNPASIPELLEWLTNDFISHGYDIKRLIRTVCTSRVYQLSSRGTPANRRDEVFYSHFLPRRMSAEVLLDAVSAATGVGEKFDGLPAGTRAIQVPDSAIASPFLDTFGRPPRATACECERVSEPTLAQALQLLSGEDVSRRLVSPAGRLTSLVTVGRRETDIVDDLYLATLSRLPNARERQIALDSYRKSPGRKGAEDLLWALLNTQEFSYVR